jgi:hypothetical protein
LDRIVTNEANRQPGTLDKQVPVRVFPAAYDWWLWLLLVGVPTAMLGLGVTAAVMDGGYAAVVVFVVFAIDTLVFWLVMPRRYEVWPDKVRVVLGWPVACNIPMATIAETRPASAVTSYVYWGFRFATRLKTAVEIRRSKGWNFVVSPNDRDEFMRVVAETAKAHQPP